MRFKLLRKKTLSLVWVWELINYLKEYIQNVLQDQLTSSSTTLLSEIFAERNFHGITFHDSSFNIYWLLWGLFLRFMCTRWFCGIDFRDSCLRNKDYVSVGIYMFKVNNRNTRTRCEIFSKLPIKTPERRHWRLYC